MSGLNFWSFGHSGSFTRAQLSLSESFFSAVGIVALLTKLQNVKADTVLDLVVGTA